MQPLPVKTLSPLPRRPWTLLVGVVLTCLLQATAAALQPDQLALIVNAKVPASRDLAEFYARKRGVPAGRIIALDLPFPEEELSAADFDAKVAPGVRSFLQDNGLKDKVTCLVTFWGVPLRIRQRTAGPGDAEQIQIVQAELEATRAQLAERTTQAEAIAKELDSSFTPAQGSEHAQIAKRAGDALTAIARAALAMQPGAQRSAAVERLATLFEKLMGEAEATQQLAAAPLAQIAPADLIKPERVERIRKQAAEWVREYTQLRTQPASPKNDAAMRTMVRDHFGLFRYYELLTAQYLTYETKETAAAFDSELSLLWWESNYPRHRWQANALNHGARAAPGTPPTLMVMRLDGPTEQSVDRIILSSLKAENEGLKGRVVLDGRGLKGDDGYGRYDSSIRRLAGLLRTRTQVQVFFDDVEGLMQPGPGAPKNVAVYCGWYSLRNYVPAFTFSEGAVGFHVASLELVSLRTPNERGWAAGLINDGVVATLGPVAEPYLHSFPPADEFFPLLMTGELTLAEVYWKTNPLTSWMNTCVGDPLYRPYKVNPPLKREELPEPLRAALPKPSPPVPAPQ